MQLTAILLSLLAAKPPADQLPRARGERCQLVLAAAAAAVADPDFCQGAAYHAEGRAIVEVYASGSSPNPDGIAYPVLAEGPVCRNRQVEVYQAGRWKRRMEPPNIVSMTIAATSVPGVYRFGANLQPLPREANTGAIVLCGMSAGVVRKSGKSWMARVDTNEHEGAPAAAPSAPKP